MASAVHFSVTRCPLPRMVAVPIRDTIPKLRAAIFIVNEEVLTEFPDAHDHLGNGCAHPDCST